MEEVKDTLPELPPSDTGTDEIMESLPDTFTDPSSAPQAESLEMSENGEVAETVFDSKGNPFNPALHISPDRLNKDGTFRKRKNAQVIEAETVESNSSLNVSKTIVFFFLQTGKAIFGQKFEANKDERNHLEETLTTYLDTKNITDLPPGLVVTIAFTSFTIAKMREEECRKNATNLFSKIKEKITPVFRKLFRRK